MLQLGREILYRVYNWSKLTILIVVSDWDKMVFNSNWSKEREAVSEQEVVLEDEGVECLESSTRGQKRQPEKEQETNKNRKRADGTNICNI